MRSILTLKEGLQLMNHKFTGFTEKAMLSGVESRSSAPVRLYRDSKIFKVILRESCRLVKALGMLVELCLVQ